MVSSALEISGEREKAPLLAGGAERCGIAECGECVQHDAYLSGVGQRVDPPVALDRLFDVESQGFDSSKKNRGDMFFWSM